MKFYILSVITYQLTAGALLVAGPLYAGPSGEGAPDGVISGLIAEWGSGDPMEYSTIALYDASDSSLIGGTVSGEDGKFEIARVPYGNYYIVTNYVGYSERVIEPVILSPDNRLVDLGILELRVNSQALEEVEIVADRRHVDYRLDKKVINVSQDINAAGGTAVDVLENTPSVTVDIEGNVALRGSSSFTVLIDGKPSVLSGTEALRQIPASTILSIEIITNPSAKYDPDGNSGIINVVLKKNAQQGTSGIVNVSAGINNKYRADFLLNRKLENWNFFLGGSYNNNLYAGSLTREQVTFGEGLDSYLDADGVFNFKHGGTQLRAGASYDFSDRATFTLEASGGTHGFGIDRSNTSHEYSIPATREVYFVNGSVMDRNGNYFSLNANYTQIFDSKDHKLTLMANYSREKENSTDSQDNYQTGDDYNIEDVVPERTRGVESALENEIRFQADYTRPLGTLGKLEAGYQLRIDDETEDYMFEEFDPVGEGWNENSLYSSDLLFFRSIQGAYATYGGEWKGLQLQLGVRGEHTYRSIDHELSAETYLINRFDIFPTLHIGKDFRNDQQLMLSYGKRVERPRGWWLDPTVSYVDPYTISMGNPELQPEYIHSMELGYQKGWGMNFLAVELYYRNTRNLITGVTEYNDSLELFIMKRENLNSDHSAGAEIMVNWKLWKWLTVNGSIAPYFYALTGVVNDLPVDETSFNWKSNLNTSFQITPTTRFQATMAYQSKSVTAQGYSNGFSSMNLAFRQDLFKRRLTASVQLRDVLGTVRVESYNFGENFEQRMVRAREPRVLTLTLSYKINNYRSETDNRTGG
jgi:outer membrane receptor protein involved in Fe transport